MRLPRIAQFDHTLFGLIILGSGVFPVLGGGGFRTHAQEVQPAAPQLSTPGKETTDERIARLIMQLGDERFPAREAAQAELAQLGFEAFDALSEAAEKHEDIEIAARARYLVGMMRFDWTREDDPAEIKQALRDYESLDSDARQQRIRQLSAGGTSGHIAALCRLARFEKSQLLSKRAALAIIEPRRRTSLGPDQRAVILAALGKSPRPAVQWLRAYVESESPPAEPAQALDNAQVAVAGVAAAICSGPGDLAALGLSCAQLAWPAAVAAGRWAKLVADEETALEQFPERTEPDLVAALLRHQVDLYERLAARSQVEATMLRLVALERGETESLLSLVPWLIKHKAWAVVDNLATRFADRFNQEPLLGYTLAQARLAQDNRQLAQELAARALAQNPGDAAAHLEVARRLRERGLMEWAVRELRYVIEVGPPEHTNTLDAQEKLAELLHDRQEELQAAQVLEPGLATLEKAAKRQGNNGQDIRRLIEEIRKHFSARVNYYYACHYASVSDTQKERERLVAASKDNPLDADVLIALLRSPNQTPEMRQEANALVEAAARQFRNDIESNPRDPTPYNQLAWLLSNTERNQEEALRCSLESLKLAPDEPGYLDTLGRCYYALGDYENAVKYQSKAVELEPHSGLMARQLELFRKTLAETKSRPK